MDVGLYISELLREKSEVSLPGIGVFKKKRKTAFYDKSKALFYPPSFQLVFIQNTAASISDSLVKYICSAKHISEPSAVYFIEKYADSVAHALSTNGTANINHLGTLKSTDGEFLFTQAEELSADANFGLMPLNELKVSFNPDKKQVQSDPASTANQELDANQVHARRSKLLWPLVLLAAILLLVTIGMAIYTYQPELAYKLFPALKEQQLKKVEKAKPAPKTLSDSLATADSIVASLQQEGFEVSKPRDTINIQTVTSKTDSVPKATTPRFEVITASFNRLSEAENYVRAMRKKGIDAQIIEDTKKPKFKVSIGSFTSNEAAQTEKRRIHAEITKEAWILTIKNNNK